MDMLVKLYDLPAHADDSRLAAGGIIVRRALAPEKHLVTKWVGDHFNAHWVSEVEKAYSNQPVSCLIATRDKELAGFVCYEATCKSFLGPMGVAETARGLGVGSVLLIKALLELKALGYAYGIIGGVGPVDFYQKVAGATVIDGSTPGIYSGMLR